MRFQKRLASSLVLAGALLVTIVASDVRTGTQAAQDDTAPRRVFALAEKLELEGKLSEAVREYRTLIEQYPGSAVANDAMFRIAVEAWIRRDAAAARATAAGVVERYPGTRGAAGATLLEALIQLDTAETDAGVAETITLLRRLRAILGSQSRAALQWGPIAALVLGDALLLRGAADEALGAYVSAASAPGAAGSLGRLGMARALLVEKQWTAAAQLLQQVISERAGAPRPPAAPGMLGTALGPEIAKTYALAGGVSPMLSAAPEAVAAAARRLATLVHRHQLAPAAGAPRWAKSRRLPGNWRQPIGVAAFSDATLIIVDEGPKSGRVLAHDATVIGDALVEDGRRPWFDADGTPYIAAEKAVMLPMARQRLTFADAQGGKPRPLEQIVTGLRDRFGGWYLLDTNRRALVRFSRDRTFRAAVAAPPNADPIDAVADERGRCYLLEPREKSVWRYDAVDRPPTRLVRAEWRRPEAMAIDALGQLYVLDRDARTIEIYDPAGKRLHVVGPTLPGGVELREPRDIAVDGAGRLYIADRELPGIVVLE